MHHGVAEIQTDDNVPGSVIFEYAADIDREETKWSAVVKAAGALLTLESKENYVHCDAALSRRA
jgi:hypothetical protein